MRLKSPNQVITFSFISKATSKDVLFLPSSNTLIGTKAGGAKET